MFFILSKLLRFLIQPVVWIVLALLGSLILPERWSRKALFTGVALLVVFTNPFLCNLAWYGWEADPVPFEAVDTGYDAVIVLGGYTHNNQKPKDRVHFSEAYDRLARGVELYQKGKADHILLTSGSPKVIGEKVKSSIILEDHLLQWGIPQEALMIEPNSRNTYENARNTARKLRDTMPDGNFLLVTSAFHMPRARACFAKQDLDVRPFPADFRSYEPSWQPDHLLIPSAGALSSWNILIKEWVGLVAYWVMGYL